MKVELRRVDRAELFEQSGGGTGDAEAPFDPFGEKLISTMGALNSTTSTLAATQNLCSETEAVGASVLNQLGTQREQLINATSHVQDTETVTGRARLILRRMGRRAVYHRLSLYFTVVVLVAANFTVLYYGFFKSS